jgi:hypothetical protein
MRLPGFTAELSLVKGRNEFRNVARTRSIRVVAEVGPQMRAAVGGLRRRQMIGGIDLDSYFRCKAAGGPELVCRFFGGLPPFTIGGLLF